MVLLPPSMMLAVQPVIVCTVAVTEKEYVCPACTESGPLILSTHGSGVGVGVGVGVGSGVGVGVGVGTGGGGGRGDMQLLLSRVALRVTVVLHGKTTGVGS